MPTPAHAVIDCLVGNPPPGRIDVSGGQSIICVNTDARTSVGPVILLQPTLSYTGQYTSLTNRGKLNATSDIFGNAGGIFIQTDSPGGGVDSPITIWNSGEIAASASDDAFGIRVQHSLVANSPISIWNSGDITINAGDGGRGISANISSAFDSPISVVNSGDITIRAANRGLGITVSAYGSNVPVSVVNTGDISLTVTGVNAFAVGISGFSPDNIHVHNSGDLWVTSTNGTSYGIRAKSYGPSQGPITIHNSGSIYAKGRFFAAGISADSLSGTTIINSGDIGASSNLAIQVLNGPVDIFNSGTITGFVLLDANDRFVNQAGGRFEARGTSDFDAYGAGGTDLFRNEQGGLVHTANNAGVAETTAFVNLETFDNQGLISTVDGGVGDVFTIANMPGTGINFSGSGGSTLAVDAFLGGPGSTADNFVVQGNVSGSTTVDVNNTNTGPGVFNPVGIPVVFVTGATPTGNEFSLAKPIDTGFFDYDLFFTPTGSGHWDLMSYPGAGAHLLPQLVTAAQDIWHQGSSTWFDRTGDLRVLLAGGPAPAAYDPGGKSLSAPAPDNFTPAVWMRGSGGWLDRDDSASTTAYGRTYNFNLDRELETIDFQMGIDFGKKDFFSQGDALVFGLLGGFVHGDLDYDNIARSFNFDGGQVGAYATYLNGGLFVDTLFNAHLYSLDTDTLGFPSRLDANTLGIRTDAGYRFGSFSGGPFLEPLATLEVTWADIDGFSLGGNTVSFDDAANVRGRVGARAGTTMQAWEGTMMEPFIIGSLWGNFTDDNQATLVSTGRTFRYQDNLDDVWGEVSGGVNFFNFSQTTSVFAKVDVTFGDDVSGVGGKAGMRVAW